MLIWGLYLENPLQPGADVGGAERGAANASPSGIRPPADPKGTPLNYFGANVYLF